MRFSNFRQPISGCFLLSAVLLIVPSVAFGDLVAHYKLDDGLADSTTTTAIDEISPASNGTLENFPVPPTPKWGTGFFGGALEFGGSGDADDVVTVTNPSSGKFDLTGTLSLSAWVLYDEKGGVNSTRHIAGIDRAGGPVDDAYSLKHVMSGSANTLAFLIAENDVDTNLTSTGTLTSYTADSVSAGNGGWVHVAGVYVPGTSMSLYINGELDNQITSGVPAAIQSVPTPFNIGRLDNSTSHSFNGFVDDVRLYDSALTLDDIRELSATDFKILIQPASGEILIQNDTLSSVDFDYYSIESDAGALKPTTGWNSLEDQGIDPVNGGDDPGEIWTEGGNSSASVLTEIFLQGSTVLAPGESLSLGAAYDTSIGGAPTFEFADAVTDIVRAGKVAFMLLGDMDGNGSLEDADVNPFVEALTNRSSYEANHPGMNADLIGDFNGNGQLDLGDVKDFKAAIAALPGSGASLASAVPEPSTAVLGVLALIGFGAAAGSRRKLSRRA